MKKNKITCQNVPEWVDNIPIKWEQYMFYLYLPIKMAGNLVWNIPAELERYRELISKAVQFENECHGGVLLQDYLYLSVKTLPVFPGYCGNRPGVHCDGFLTDDVNYIWSDCYPTIFYKGEFNVTADHENSLTEFEKQAKDKVQYSLFDNDLIRVDPLTVHSIPVIDKPGTRTFFKLSISKNKYNLKGNSHNHLFHYKWEIFERTEVRNNPVHNKFKDADSIPNPCS